MHPLDLPLEYLDLAPQGQHLSLQLRLVGAAGDEQIQQGAQQQVYEVVTNRSSKARSSKYMREPATGPQSYLTEVIARLRTRRRARRIY